MAAPTPFDRGTVLATPLPDGYKTTLTLSSNPTIRFFEKTVQPPSVGVGDVIDLTTMLNHLVTTKWFGKLADWGDVVVKGGYSTMVVADIMVAVGVNDTLTITWPDGAQLAAFGGLRMAEFDALERNKMPEGTFTFTITNMDPVDCTEHAPVFIPGTGTGNWCP